MLLMFFWFESDVFAEANFNCFCLNVNFANSGQVIE